MSPTRTPSISSISCAGPYSEGRRGFWLRSGRKQGMA